MVQPIWDVGREAFTWIDGFNLGSEIDRREIDFAFGFLRGSRMSRYRDELLVLLRGTVGYQSPEWGRLFVSDRRLYGLHLALLITPVGAGAYVQLGIGNHFTNPDRTGQTLVEEQKSKNL